MEYYSVGYNTGDRIKSLADSAKRGSIEKFPKIRKYAFK